MIRNKLTFRQVFFTMCILLIANMLVILFTFATPKFDTAAHAQPVENLSTTTHRDQDGTLCADQNCYYNMDAKELGRSYQIELNDNDATVWDGKRYVGKIKFNRTCQFNRLMIEDNR